MGRKASEPNTIAIVLMFISVVVVVGIGVKLRSDNRVLAEHRVQREYWRRIVWLMHETGGDDLGHKTLSLADYHISNERDRFLQRNRVVSTLTRQRNNYAKFLAAMRHVQPPSTYDTFNRHLIEYYSRQLARDNDLIIEFGNHSDAALGNAESTANLSVNESGGLAATMLAMERSCSFSSH